MRTTEQLEIIDQLIDDCRTGEDKHRRIVHAFDCRFISKGLQGADGRMHPETVSARERHQGIADELARFQQALWRYWNGEGDTI